MTSLKFFFASYCPVYEIILSSKAFMYLLACNRNLEDTSTKSYVISRIEEVDIDLNILVQFCYCINSDSYLSVKKEGVDIFEN